MSRSELQRKLKTKYPDEEGYILKILDEMERVELLNDKRYTEQLINHLTQRPIGRMKIMMEFRKRGLDEELMEELIERQKPPKKITYQGVIYSLEKESPGYFHNIAKGDNWEEFRSWDFEDAKGEHLLCIEQWDEKEFEASVGKRVQEFEISNILPAEDKK